ncbi:L-proline glycine betaine ABC transport system permease protein ProV [Labilithrix luteola]|uniref:L-proline glycine betaine ABC transport system permease protein ProV n=1 Tax=Labilithrix luteola TaxID=1391654 RepID=A0A0K1Q1M3_9BACT|nr:ABC transporter ATP-binding protein [Labilithrix luteola]AKU99690.1 L-proline glycine betaine ABC transport system permease protein ProV [Labilithrix luteola]
MVSLEGVSKSFEGRAVIHRTSLQIGARERVALIGPSGCGKSTLLRMILGLVIPDTGTVTVGKVQVTEATAREVRRRIGYVIQDGGLFPHLTAEDNVTLVARLGGMPTERMRARVDELVDLAGLPKTLLARYPRALSGGERQRVGLMRALMLDPDVLLLDEPLGALDPIIRARLQEDLRTAFQRLGKSVVIVTHDMGEAAYLADSIAVMRDGRIVQQGGVRDLIDHPADPFVSEFVGAQRSLAGAIA